MLMKRYIFLTKKWIELLIITILLSGCSISTEDSLQPPQPVEPDYSHCSTATPEAPQTELPALIISESTSPTRSPDNPTTDADKSQTPPATPETAQTELPEPAISETTSQPIPTARIPAPEPPEKFPKGLVTNYDLVLLYNNKELFLDMQKEELIDILDCPITNTEIDNESFDEFTIVTVLFEDGTKAVFTDDTLYSLTVGSNKYITPRGLRVGDSVEKLLELYGEPEYIHEGVYTYGYYISNYDLFIVTTDNGTVVSIMITMIM